MCILPWTSLRVGDWYKWENSFEIYLGFLKYTECFSHEPMPSADRFVISNGFKLQSPNTTCNTSAQFTTLFSHLSQCQIWKIQLLTHRPEGLWGCWKSWNIPRVKIYDLCFFPFNTNTLSFSTVQRMTCLRMDMAPEPSLWGGGNASGHLERKKIFQENSTNWAKIMVGLLSTRFINLQGGTTVVTGHLVVLIHRWFQCLHVHLCK